MSSADMLSALAKIDLNLLLALRVLLREAHVSRAAEQLEISQPAMSRSLARLREIFADPLLVRAGRAMQLTSRARELLPRLEDVLAATAELIDEPTFDPQSARGSLRIAAPDVVSYMLVPPLLRRMARLAPGLDLHVVRWRPQWQQQLEQGETDLTVGFPRGTEANVYAETLFDVDWAVVLRRNHPLSRRRWCLRTYGSADHAQVSIGGGAPPVVDQALRAAGLERRVALTLPYPLLTPFIVAESDLVLTTVRWLALKLSRVPGLLVRRPPLPLPRLNVPMVWHARSHRDPRHSWIREQVRAVAAEDVSPNELRWP